MSSVICVINLNFPMNVTASPPVLARANLNLSCISFTPSVVSLYFANSLSIAFILDMAVSYLADCIWSKFISPVRVGASNVIPKPSPLIAAKLTATALAACAALSTKNLKKSPRPLSNISFPSDLNAIEYSDFMVVNGKTLKLRVDNLDTYKVIIFK